MTLIASDGLEYENITQRLLGNPLENNRNGSIFEIRYAYPENEVAAYIKGYDKARGPHSDKYHAGWRAVSAARLASYRS